jgi:hypothetical protein
MIERRISTMYFDFVISKISGTDATFDGEH